ncbi:MAG: Serine/threonine protein kinase, partial [Myxococcaceae bacterium]|nr:Serine/threonine protein kinase [Myxococcaceae bacterium]
MLPLACPLCRIALPPVDDVCPRDGHSGRQVSWLPVPASLAQRFQVLEPFAHGDGGSLYIVDEPETGRRGLLKILTAVPKEQLGERQRLRRELVKQATLARTHLLVPLASGETEGVTWLFREWLDGVALDVRLSREGALPQTEALAIAAQIGSALDELHRGGLLHRDVKPGHIFLQPTPNGIPRALLIDAGVASRLSGDGASTIYGSAGYVAPEQLLGKLVSFRSDLYSLGCVLYRMLTGRPAFAGESLEQTLSVQRNGELPPTPADLPNGIGALLQSILAKDPQQRPFSAQKLRRTLDPFLPDGALMEKQSTTTFETVPQPSPSIAPQPSGTLKPPPPPAVRPSMAAPPPPEAALKPRMSSAPPPPPPSRQPLPEERTQQIDLAQLVEQPQPKRSVPPPTPATKSSLPPPRPAQLNEKTQPIRLDQILAVESARKEANNPPPGQPQAPKPLEDEATGVFHPRHVAGAPKAAPASEPPPHTHTPALFAA